MKKVVLIRLLLVVLSVFILAAGYGSVYVQTASTKILKKPSFRSEQVIKVKKSTKLRLLEKKGRWYRVSYKGKKGWVSAMTVGSRLPMKRISITDKRRGDISRYARRRASVVTATAAARGLAQDDRRRLGDMGAADFLALERVEAIEISDAELTSFIEDTK